MATKYVLKLAKIVYFFGEDNKAFTKGENALESGHVETMHFDAELMLIRGTVHASMKNKVYKVEISLDKTEDISSAQCSCPKGIKCHHIAALLLFAHYNISITDKHCTWRNTTKSKSEEIITCDEMYPKKPYCAIDRKMTQDEVEELRGQLNNFGATIGFTWHLQKEPNESTVLLVPDIGEIICTEEFLSANNKAAYLTQKCAVTDSAIMDLVHKTVGQHKNENWLLARKHRLTASNFGPVLSACRRNRFPDSLYRNLTGVYNLDGVKAIQWGRTHESIAIENFTATTNLNVQPTGLWLTPQGFLGGSPDGLVGEDSIIEVKCPYSHRNDNLQDKLKNVKSYIIYFNDDGDLHINKQHHYYDQIQGLLYILNRLQCYLVIWSLKGSIIAIIKKDLSWASNVQILQNFYVNQYIPKLIETMYNVK